MSRAEFLRIRIDKIAEIERIQSVRISDLVMKYRTVADIVADRTSYENIVTTNGRIVNTRNSRVFLLLRSAANDIQIMLNKECNFYPHRSLLDNGDCIYVTGRLSYTQAGELTIFATEIYVSAKSLHSVRDQYFLQGETTTMSRTEELCFDRTAYCKLLLRSRIIAAVREFFTARNYLEVETPILQEIYGGAVAEPFITRYNLYRCDMYLRIAPELYLKRLVVAGYEKIFEIGKVFRNEGRSTVHSPEFTMLECYTRNFRIDDIMLFIREFYSTIFVAVKQMHLDLALSTMHLVEREYIMMDFQESIQDILKGRTETAETVEQIISEYGIDPEDRTASNVYEHIITNVFIKLQNADKNVLLFNFPADISPLAKCYDGVARRVEFYSAGVEIMNGYEENNDYFVQKSVFESYCKVVDEDYLKALGEGLQFTGGLGIGLDRFIMQLTDCKNISQAISF